MKLLLKWTGVIFFAIFIGLALSMVYMASVRAQAPLPSLPNGGGARQGDSPSGLTTSTSPYSSMMGWDGQGYDDNGWGMMGSGMMGGGMHGGMMGGYGSGYDAVPQGTPAPADEEIQLTATDLRFVPATITVKASETVRLVVANKDNVPHNLYSSEVPIAYRLFPARATQSINFTAPQVAGTYQAVCTFHPGMTLNIVVK
jgi:plastocyanin